MAYTTDTYKVTKEDFSEYLKSKKVWGEYNPNMSAEETNRFVELLKHYWVTPAVWQLIEKNFDYYSKKFCKK